MKTKTDNFALAHGETVRTMKLSALDSIPVRTGLSDVRLDNIRQAHAKGDKLPPISAYKREDGSLALYDGNHRLKVARELGHKSIRVLRTNFSAIHADHFGHAAGIAAIKAHVGEEKWEHYKDKDKGWFSPKNTMKRHAIRQIRANNADANSTNGAAFHSRDGNLVHIASKDPNDVRRWRVSAIGVKKLGDKPNLPLGHYVEKTKKDAIASAMRDAGSGSHRRAQMFSAESRKIPATQTKTTMSNDFSSYAEEAAKRGTGVWPFGYGLRQNNQKEALFHKIAKKHGMTALRTGGADLSGQAAYRIKSGKHAGKVWHLDDNHNPSIYEQGKDGGEGKTHHEGRAAFKEMGAKEKTQTKTNPMKTDTFSAIHAEFAASKPVFTKFESRGIGDGRREDAKRDALETSKPKSKHPEYLAHFKEALKNTAFMDSQYRPGPRHPSHAGYMKEYNRAKALPSKSSNFSAAHVPAKMTTGPGKADLKIGGKPMMVTSLHGKAYSVVPVHHADGRHFWDMDVSSEEAEKHGGVKRAAMHKAKVLKQKMNFSADTFAAKKTAKRKPAEDKELLTNHPVGTKVTLPTGMHGHVMGTAFQPSDSGGCHKLRIETAIGDVMMHPHELKDAIRPGDVKKPVGGGKKAKGGTFSAEGLATPEMSRFKETIKGHASAGALHPHLNEEMQHRIVSHILEHGQGAPSSGYGKAWHLVKSAKNHTGYALVEKNKASGGNFAADKDAMKAPRGTNRIQYIVRPKTEKGRSSLFGKLQSHAAKAGKSVFMQVATNSPGKMTVSHGKPEGNHFEVKPDSSIHSHTGDGSFVLRAAKSGNFSANANEFAAPSSLTNNEFYGGLNKRFKSRTQKMAKMGMQYDKEKVGWSHPGNGSYILRGQPISNEFVLHADKRSFHDRLARHVPMQKNTIHSEFSANPTAKTATPENQEGVKITNAINSREKVQQEVPVMRAAVAMRDEFEGLSMKPAAPKMVIPKTSGGTIRKNPVGVRTVPQAQHGTAKGAHFFGADNKATEHARVMDKIRHDKLPKDGGIFQRLRGARAKGIMRYRKERNANSKPKDAFAALHAQFGTENLATKLFDMKLVPGTDTRTMTRSPSGTMGGAGPNPQGGGGGGGGGGAKAAADNLTKVQSENPTPKSPYESSFPK